MKKISIQGIANQIRKICRVPQKEKIVVREWPLALFYIVFTCKYEVETGKDPDPKRVAALKQFLNRVALRGEPINPEEAMARLLSPECSGEELAAFIEGLAAGDHVKDQDFYELFFNENNEINVIIPPKEYAEKNYFK